MEMPHISASKTLCLLDVGSSENPRGRFVSTTLCLYDETWPCENPKKRMKSTHDPKVSCRPTNNNLTGVQRNIARMRYLSNEEREEEERYGVSTELTLFTDPWTIKKELTMSNLGQLSHILLETSFVHNHILRYISEYDQKMVQEGSGLTVKVYDHDTDSMHKLLLSRFTECGSYYIQKDGWNMNFVRRRALKKKDKIGMFWDRFDSKLHFRVLSRASNRS